jgi:hypothetical protein
MVTISSGKNLGWVVKKDVKYGAWQGKVLNSRNEIQNVVKYIANAKLVYGGSSKRYTHCKNFNK